MKTSILQTPQQTRRRGRPAGGKTLQVIEPLDPATRQLARSLCASLVAWETGVKLERAIKLLEDSPMTGTIWVGQAERLIKIWKEKFQHEAQNGKQAKAAKQGARRA